MEEEDITTPLPQESELPEEIKNFNLLEAVIYSAILERKYDE